LKIASDLTLSVDLKTKNLINDERTCL